MDIVDRLIAYRNYTGLSNSQFADKAGIPRPTLSQFLNGRNKRLSDDLTGKLHLTYPDLNIMWLLFGEGDMLNAQNIKISEGKIEGNNDIPDPQLSGNERILYPESTYERYHKSESIQQNTPENYEPNIDLLKEGMSEIENTAMTDAPNLQADKFTKSPSLPTNPTKKIQSIMVFYSDNSFEIFTPGN